jgi:hypothetical protein
MHTDPPQITVGATVGSVLIPNTSASPRQIIGCQRGSCPLVRILRKLSAQNTVTGGVVQRVRRRDAGATSAPTISTPRQHVYVSIAVFSNTLRQFKNRWSVSTMHERSQRQNDTSFSCLAVEDFHVSADALAATPHKGSDLRASDVIESILR